ncbi:MAG: TonB-dependent receptor [Bacteroidales bacterium]|nr:TonB-dependent receptor [Bacteroidales bacterium]
MKKHELLKTRFIIVLLVLFSTSGAVFALPWQNSGKNEAVSPPEKEIKVSGKITSADNEPIIGASVRVEGTTNGTVSDVNGYYSLNVYIGAKLTFSYVGYKSTTVQVSRAGELNQVLQEDSKVMDELVVVGYGVQKKATLSGSIAGVNGKEILKSPAMNVTNSLAGNVAGLVVVGQSGEPGADYSSLYIRGTGSLNDNSPLIVVDGVPNRSLERIDPSTIENISVLKDASAAIYGSQAANGVILVTTKRGKAEKMGITASYSAGWSRPTYLPEVCNSAEYATLVNEVNQYAGKNPIYTTTEIQKFADGNDPWKYPNTNWFNEVLKPWSMQHNANISMSGGTETVKTYVSLSTRYQDGFFKNSGSNYAQHDLKANIDGKINKYISLGVDFTGRMEQGDFLSVGSSTLFYELQSASPLLPARWPNGLAGPPLDLQVQHNPVVQSTSASGYNRTDNYVFNLTSRLTVKIPGIDGLTWTTTGALDRGLYYTKKLNKKYELYTWDGTSADADGIPVLVKGLYGASSNLMQQFELSKEYMVNSLLNYQHTFNKVHDIGILAGIEAFETTSNWFSAERRDNSIEYPEELNFGNDNEQYSNGSNPGIDRWFNYLGRVNYAYSGKYMLEFVWRYQGSSKFYDTNRYGFFPGVSAAYRISEEDFWKNSSINNVINGLKFRGSWGLTGNDKIDSYQFMSQYAKYWQNFVTGSTSSNMAAYYESLAGNIKAHWEEARQFDVGFDLNMLNNKLTLTADYFNNLRTKILIAQTASVPDFTGLSGILPSVNLGKVRNKGFDFELAWSDKINNFSYRVGLNGGYAANKVLFFDEASNIPEYQQNTGHPMNSGIYYDAIGIFHNQGEIDNYPHMDGTRPGDVIFRDVNDDKMINGLDKIRINKSAIPTWTGGLNLYAKYKGFDLSVLFQGQAGAVRYVQQTGSLTNNKNYLKSFFDNRWTESNPNTDYPRTFNRNDEYWVSSDNPNTFWLHKTDFIRLKNLELGYTLPDVIIKKFACQSIRLTVSGMNLFTYAPDMKDYDPELSYQGEGFAGAGYPIQKIITTGISINF